MINFLMNVSNLSNNITTSDLKPELETLLDTTFYLEYFNFK